MSASVVSSGMSRAEGGTEDPGRSRRAIARERPVTQIERDYPEDEKLISETDLKGFITSANASFCAVAGYTHEELIGQRHNIVRHPDVPREVFADFWRTIQAGARWTGIVKNRCKNGDHYWVKAFVSPILRDGRPVGYRSVRVKPTREEIAAAERLYEQVRRGEVKLDTLAELRRRTPWIERTFLGRLGVGAQMALVAGWILLSSAAALGAMHRGAPPAAVWGLWGAAAAAGAAASVAAARGWSASIRKLRRLAQALEHGDLSARLGVYGDSDLSSALRELDLALDNVELIISEMAQVFAGMAEGDLGRRVLVTLPPPLARIQQAVNEAAERIEATIDDLSSRMQDLAEGRLHNPARRQVACAGKLRAAQERAVAAAHRLSQLLEELMRLARALSEGDLTPSIDAPVEGDLRRLQVHFDAALANLRAALRALQENSKIVATAAEEVAAGAKQIAEVVETEAEAVRRMQRTVQDVGAEVRVAAGAAEDARRRSQEAVDLVQGSRAKMRSMADIIRAVEQRSREIAGITGLIEEVAEQTNLLALNAAIEAARAGDSGRGFAVVADEVRRLAVGSGQAAEKIRALIDDALGSIRQVASAAGEVEDAMDGAEQGIRSADDTLRELSQVLSHQQQVLDQATAAVASSYEAARDGAAATQELVTQQLAVRAEELSRSAAETEARVSQFRVA